MYNFEEEVSAILRYCINVFAFMFIWLSMAMKILWPFKDDLLRLELMDTVMIGSLISSLLFIFAINLFIFALNYDNKIGVGKYPVEIRTIEDWGRSRLMS